MATDPSRVSRSLTLEHVARAAGVSRATVSRVINGTRNVDPAIQTVVQRAIDATGYVPNRAARSLVTRRTGSIALVVSTTDDQAFETPFLGQVFTDPYFGRVASGVLSALRHHGTRLVLMAAETEETRKRLVRDLRQGDVDGIALVSMRADDPLPGILADLALPVVMLGRPGTPLPISYIDLAHQNATAMAATRLVERGCTRIATICGPANTTAGQDRLAGFRAAMARLGHGDIPSFEGAFTVASGEAAMRDLLAAHPDVNGVFVANDLMAQGALLVLADTGRKAPDDVAVVGFDDSSAATASRPTLTTIRQPIEDMAATLTSMLLSKIDEPCQRSTSVIFEPELVRRQSA